MKNKRSKFLDPMDFSTALDKEMGSFDFNLAIPSQAAKKNKLFLRNFTADDLYEIMTRVKLIEHLESRGFDKMKVQVNVDDGFVHYMKLYYRNVDPDSLLIDLRVSESRFTPDKSFFEDESLQTYDMIVIEWLSAQNPLNSFNNDRPQLPGQRRPGLGALNYCFEMMHVVAREIIKDGFLDIPDHMHGALMYAKKFKFFNPVHEGILRAIMRDLEKFALADISWGIITQTIIEEYKNQPQTYAPSEQVFYVSERMRGYFHSKKYLSTFNKYYKGKRYRFDYDEMVKRRDVILKSKSIMDL